MKPPDPFRGIPVNAEEQFRLALLGCVLDILERERKGGQLNEFLAHFAFLQSYAERISILWQTEKLPRAADWKEALANWQNLERLPLDRLYSMIPSSVAMNAVIMIAAIEEDPRFALLIEPEGGAPTLGGMTVFLSDMFPSLGTGTIRAQLFSLASLGIITICNQDQPRIDWKLRVTQATFEAISGAPCERSYLHIAPVESLPEACSWISPSEAAEKPETHATCMSTTPANTTLIRGDQHNGRKTFVRMAARKAGLAVIHIGTEALAEKASWHETNLIAALLDALLLIECSPGPGDRVTLPLSPVRAPYLAIVTTHSASIDHGRPDLPFFPIELPRPDRQARAKHWQEAGWSREAQQLSERVLTSGHIRRIATGAKRETKPGSVHAMEHSLVAIRDPRLETTAQRVTLDDRLDELVVDDLEREELDGLILRCRLREELHGSSEAGVKALFSGPSGSGKTLAAKNLARELKRPLYRIDLAATVNKYIGETEKNLEQALAAAEELDIVLLLDEGDALLAKRTDVGSATDRYANMETNFLLQRLEEFRGIILVTTNDGERIDGAFRRRMDAIIPFRLPDQLRRQEILQLQLGDHQVSQGLIDEVACRCSFSGGQIHNIVMHARLLSLADKTPIGNAHLVKSVEREYRKTGEHCPLRPTLAKAG
ncbi:MAG: ATP-binding protein [Pseudomonadota bacterium]